MSKEKIVEKLPWKWILLGIVLELVFVTFFFAYQWVYPASSGYNRGSWAQDFLYDQGFFVAFYIVLLTLLAVLGKNVEPSKLGLLYVFMNSGWALAFIGIQAGSLMQLPLMHADRTNWVPKYWVLSQSEISSFNLGGPMNLAEVAPPTLYWLFTFLALYLSLFFLGMIFRKPLVETQRLTFPWQVPVFETINTAKDPKQGITKEKFLWFGFAFAWVLYIWDILRVVSFGAIPRIPLRNQTWAFNYVDWTPYTKGVFGFGWNFPMFFGLYFVPLDVLLTLNVWMWFWYFIVAAVGQSTGIFPDDSARGYGRVASGIRERWAWPKLMHIDWGVIVGLGLWLLWSSKDHLRNVLKAMSGKKELDDPDMSFKWTVPGFIICAVLFLATMLVSGGMVNLSLFFFVWFYIINLGFMRIRGDLWFGGHGTWQMDMSHAYLHGIYIEAGAGVYGTTGAFVVGTYSNAFPAGTDAYAGYETALLDATKVNREVGGSGKQVVFASLIALLIGAPFAMLLRLGWGYAGLKGQGGWFPGNEWYVYGFAYMSTNGVWDHTPGTIPNYLTGIVLTFVVMLLRSKFAWFPLNPVGFLVYVGGWFQPSVMLIVLLAWIWKFATWKIGGAALNRKMMMLSIGFIGGYFLKEILNWVIGMGIGPTMLPPA